MPFNIEFICFIFIPYHFPLLFAAFFVPSNRKYATWYYRYRFRFRFVLNVKRKTSENVLISNDVFHWTTSCDSKPFRIVRMIFIFLIRLAHTFNFQMFVFLALPSLPCALSVFKWKRKEKKMWATPGCNPGLTDGVCFDRSVSAVAKHWKPTSARIGLQREHLLFGRISNIFVCESAIRIRLCICRRRRSNNSSRSK